MPTINLQFIDMSTIKFICKQALTLCFFFAAESALAQVTVTDPWIAATVSVQKSSAAFMQLKSEQALTLVQISSPVAGLVELHNMSMDGGVMRMRQIENLTLLPGQTVELTRSGMHLMVMDLKQQLKVGETIPLTLTFESTDKNGKKKKIEQKLSVPVRDQSQVSEPTPKH